MKNKTLLFVPVYNCEIQIKRVLTSISDAQLASKIDGLLIIDNQSVDHTLGSVIEGVTALGFNNIWVYRNSVNYSLGGSHKIAFNLALELNYGYLITLHGDDQANVHDIFHILNLIETDSYDMILGSRFMKGSIVDGYSLFRVLGNQVLNFVVSLRMFRYISDLGSGLNAFSADFMKDTFFAGCSDGLTFNNHLILCDRKRNRKRIFFPITWTEKDQVSNARIFRQAYEIVRLIFFYGRSQTMNKKFHSCIHAIHESELVWGR